MPRTATATPLHYQPLRTTDEDDRAVYVLFPVDEETVKTVGDLAGALHDLQRERPRLQVRRLASHSVRALILERPTASSPQRASEAEREADERLFLAFEIDYFGGQLALVARDELPEHLVRRNCRTITEVDRRQHLTVKVARPSGLPDASVLFAIEMICRRAEELGIALA